ncbi:unnamed protein product (macronuclear) [Paramecium tetraurelia]|uniref:Enkurin domain-containing protein n=1 Tax=Paramecium tetraurelia TaxID=5888 RepID=A0DF19_PARTE|nr:uncharacterized protein GSPATT00016462001 [Paramecium tetraurelia]CAK81636.1 unnamed protein product [Paramecium tetraurelia]|eukprot:XP_001449033.1 hypothetical protein (macronuclear) [Paramecium tetraurelia strain d4-2]
MQKKFNQFGIESKDSTMNLFRVRPQYLTHVSPVAVEAAHQNFFSGSKELLDKIPDHEKGPRQDSKGNIVKYTVVGSVQQFLAEKSRSQSQNRKPAQIRITANSQATPSTQQQNDQTERVIFSSKAIEQSSKDIQQKKTKVKTRDFQEVILNEDQVQDHIYQIQQRIERNRMENEKKTRQLQSRMSKGESLKMSKCERVIETFDQVQQDWDLTKIKIESKIQRLPGQSLLDRIEQHRMKEEMKRILDALKPIEEKQGNEFWRLGLRKNDSNIKPKTFVELFEKNYQIYGNPKSPQIEIVRRSSLSQLDFKPFSTFTSQSALNKKLSENSDLIMKLIPTVPDDIGNLEVVGKNVLEQEIVQLRSQSHKNSFPYVRFSSNSNYEKYIMKVPTKPETQQDEEIIEENYDRKRLMSQGKLSEVKGYF